MGGKPERLDETEEQRALSEIAARRFNRYKETFAPLENAYIQDVLDVRSQGAYETVGALASSNFQREFQRANEDLEGSMIQQGVDPTSGVFQGNSAALRRAAAVRQGLGVSAAMTDNTNRFYQGVGGIIAMGQGQSSDAIGGMASLADTAQRRAISDARASFESASGLRAGIGRMAGMAASPFVDSAMKKERAPANGR